MSAALATCRRPLMIATVAASALLLTACGSSASHSPVSGGQPSQVQSVQAAVKFSDCMRSHGVANFPDPTTSPHAFKQAFNPGTQASPAFQSAISACRRLLPARGQQQSPTQSPAQIAAALAFARCIRSHGFPTFPDPSSTGELTHEMVANAGINVHQPAVLRAGDACAPVTHGLITTADVARFVAGH